MKPRTVLIHVVVLAVGILVWPGPWRGSARVAFAQQAPGEWQFLPPAGRLDQPKGPERAPGDGSMYVRVIRFDERGGEAEAHLELSQAVCARGGLDGAPGPRGEVEVIYFKWTFTSPILRLRPGDPIPVNVETWVQQASQRCPNAGAFRSFVRVIGNEMGTVVPGAFIPVEQRNQYWGVFANAFQPAPPGVRFEFSPGFREQVAGHAVLRVHPHRVPAPTEPQGGWFAIHLHTNATRGGGDGAAFFYTYVFSPGAIPGDLATQDMIRRAGRDGRFGSPIAGSQGAALEWAPGLELRWMDFTFSNGRQIRIYHATSKANRAVRFTIFWDPDRGGWTNWEPAA